MIVLSLIYLAIPIKPMSKKKTIYTSLKAKDEYKIKDGNNAETQAAFFADL